MGNRDEPKGGLWSSPDVLRAQKKAWEIENGLTARDFSGDSYVKARAAAGIEMFFSWAFARRWVDAESGQGFYLIFCEHHVPTVIAIEDDAYCIQLTRKPIPSLDE